MISRDGDTLAYDVENRLTSVTKAGVTTTFAYNGDGTRVRRITPTGTTYFIGNYYEVYVPTSGSTTFNKYYYFGAQRVAAKIANTLFYLQGDHLGSSSLVMNTSGGLYTRQTYFPFGAQRTTEGSALPTDYTFTGQKYDAATTLMYYGARYYDTTLGRFTQPDTLVPSPLNPQAFNRYAYVYNNPVRFTDPSGHIPCNDPADCNPGQGGDDQPTDDPNVQPEPETPYCEQYPEANGCALPPADTDDNQGPEDDGECNMAGCGREEPSEQTKPEVASCLPGSSKSCPFFPGFQPPNFLPSNWTITWGIGGAVEAVLGLQGDLGFFTIASNGEIQFVSVSPGGRLASGFGGVLDGFLMVTNAKSVDELKAWSVNLGGNVDFLGLGVDKVWGKGYDGWRLSEGIKGTVTIFPSPEGVPVPVPAEIHGGASYTFMSPVRFWLW
jgi:RHS repeat-associated protein